MPCLALCEWFSPASWAASVAQFSRKQSALPCSVWVIWPSMLSCLSSSVGRALSRKQSALPFSVWVIDPASWAASVAQLGEPSLENSSALLFSPGSEHDKLNFYALGRSWYMQWASIEQYTRIVSCLWRSAVLLPIVTIMWISIYLLYIWCLLLLHSTWERSYVILKVHSLCNLGRSLSDYKRHPWNEDTSLIRTSPRTVLACNLTLNYMVFVWP